MKLAVYAAHRATSELLTVQNQCITFQGLLTLLTAGPSLRECLVADAVPINIVQ